jgi:prephenate dehydratase
VRVAFLGPEGTFSEEAMFASAGRAGVEPVSAPTIYECVMAVANGRADRALVPIENSLEGSVNATLDALVFETDEVSIVGEFVHPIQHTLIARSQISLDRIERVVSHPQASAQCARFLRDKLGAAEVVAAASTADAVRVVAESDQPWAALGNHLAAEIYDAEILADRVEDTPDNETRFVWLARKSSDLRTAHRDLPSKTSIVFWGLPDHPGALVDVLQEFAKRGINLSKIESRPRKQGLGRYVFFADLEAAADDPQVTEALAAIDATVETLRILGCYPAGSS